MTQEQKELLRPFADTICNMLIGLAGMEPEDQHALLSACEAAGSTNCWCVSYDAAQLLKPELRRLLQQSDQK